MLNNMITEVEKRSLLFYQGGAEKIILPKEENHLKDFYADPKAYEVINTLLFPGIENETTRICKEKRELNPVLLDYMPELLKVYCDIYSAMCKYTYCKINNEDYYLYRKDRMNTLLFLEDGYIPCFFSTSRTDDGNEFTCKKDGLLLLELEVPSIMEHLDVNEVLGELSMHPEEEEILLSPFLHFNRESLDLTAKDLLLKDKNQEPPKEKYKLTVKSSAIPSALSMPFDYILNEKIKDKILNAKTIHNVKSLWRNLQQGNTIDVNAISEYNEWKEDIRNYLKMQFMLIKAKTYENKKWGMLENEINVWLHDTNTKRNFYDDNFTKINVTISCLQPLSALFLAISFIEQLGVWGTVIKVMSLVASTGCIILSGIAKSYALEGKCRQRTKTYLRLDELRREIRYEEDRSLESLNKYIEEFKQIVKDDDACCIENMTGTVTYFNTLQTKNNSYSSNES